MVERFHDVYLVLLDTAVEMSPNLQCHVHLGSFPFRAMLLVQNVKLVKPVLTLPRHRNTVLMELTVSEVPHLANTVLQDTAVPLLVLLSAPVQQALSLCEVWLTALSVLLGTCVHPRNKELFAVHLEPQHLAKEGN